MREFETTVDVAIDEARRDSKAETLVADTVLETVLSDGKTTGEGIVEDEKEDGQYPSMKRVAIIMIALYLAMFLIALDRSIVSTAVPSITDEFNSLGDVGWYGSAYLLTGCSFQLQFGRIYTLFNTKHVLLGAIVMFEVGSAICGAAPTSAVFIIGRSIAGAAGAGVFSGVIVIMIPLLPLRKRPAFQGAFGAIFGLSSVIGPLMGGALTSVSWRWCFYINLPIGGFTLLVLCFLIKIPNPEKTNITSLEKFKRLDPLGNFLFLPAMVCLLLALQWGGSEYDWSNSRIVALLVLFGTMIIIWLGIQAWEKETATLPLRILHQRSIASGAFYSICLGAVMMIWIYFLPIYFQAIFGSSAIRSGIQLLPLVLSVVVGSVVAGFLVTAIGYYTPFMITGSCIMAVGAGLCSTFGVDTGAPKWIGYQIVVGLGLGVGTQQGSVAAQRVLNKADVPTGVSLMFYAQNLGGTVFVSAAQNVLSTNLMSNLVSFPRIDPHTVIHTGATDLRTIFSSNELPQVLMAYNEALIQTYYIALGASCVSILAGLSMEWKSIKEVKHSNSSKSGVSPSHEMD
ncbi:MAG: hypothetical protein Q9222_002651 [Ikaeria aurantiellina]